MICAVAVDLTRLLVYGQGLVNRQLDLLTQAGGLAKVGATCLAAFLDAWQGKVTITAVRLTTALMMALVGLGLTAGVLA